MQLKANAHSAIATWIDHEWSGHRRAADSQDGRIETIHDGKEVTCGQSCLLYSVKIKIRF